MIKMENKIRLKEWKEFKIGDLFDIHPTKSYKMNNSLLLEDDGTNPVVVNSCYNNGIGGYTNKDNTEKGNIITFSDTTSASSIFYQQDSFVGYPHVQGMYPIGKYKNRWNKYIFMFFITVFRKKAINLGYDYVNKFTRDSARKIMIQLPVDKDNNPDWNYMEQYMTNMEKKTKEILSKISNLNLASLKFDVGNWKKYKLEDIFYIHSSSGSDTGKMKDYNPEIALISRKGFNNGFVNMVDRVSSVNPFQAGFLSLALGGAYLGACFVQPQKFYTGEHMVVLEPKFEMTFNQKLFISTIITKTARLKYRAFVDEMDSHIKSDFFFYLPVLKDGSPDYKYMEQYMSELFNKIRKNVECFKNIK